MFLLLALVEMDTLLMELPVKSVLINVKTAPHQLLLVSLVLTLLTEISTKDVPALMDSLILELLTVHLAQVLALPAPTHQHAPVVILQSSET